MTQPLSWDDDQVVCGVRMRAHFFIPELVDARTDFVQRQLPVFQRARPTLLVTESDASGKNFVYGELIAQPDAVLEHGNGLIAVEYKSNSGRSHDRVKWPQQVKLKAVLQAVAAAMAVAGARAKPTAAFLRSHNALYLLDPRQEVIDFMVAQIPAAKSYWGETRRVNATQLGEFCEAGIARSFRVVDEVRSAAGVRRHEEMLRR